MAQNRVAGKFAFLLHADVAGSTSLVQRDEHLAHERIQAAFRRFGDTVARYHGRVRELRGDALLAEFDRASDAVTAALAFQSDQAKHNVQIEDDIRPAVRVGIAMGEVVVADRTVTGAGVVLAQRMEQLAAPGGVCITGAIHESLPQRMPFVQQSLGERSVKGFDEPVRAYTVQLRDGVDPPGPAELSENGQSRVLRVILIAATVTLICGGGLLAWYQPWAPEFEPVSPEAMTQPLPAKPSIAVLPFEDLNIGDDQNYLSDAISEGIITELSRFSELFVIARNSSFKYRDKPTDVREIARDLGVRYVLEGSLQTVEEQLRVTVQLIDAVAGNHVWAERYDRDLLDIFAVQDEIVRSVSGAVGRKIVRIAGREAKRADQARLRAFEHWLLGVQNLNEYTQEGVGMAQRAFLNAIELDRNLSHAHVGMTYVHIYGYRHGWTDLNPDEALASARASAQTALDLAPSDYSPYYAMALVEMLSGDLDRAIGRFQQALDLNPNAANVMASMAEALSYAGRWQEAVDLLRKASRLDPHTLWMKWNLAWAEWGAGDCQSALSTMQSMPRLPSMARRTLATIYVCLGRTEEARATIVELLEDRPGYSIAAVRESLHDRFTDPAELERWIDDLRTAGLPE